MARYIDVDALIAEIESNSRKTWSEDINTVFWVNAVKIKDNIKRCIERQPTVDVVPRAEVERMVDEGEYWQGKYLAAKSEVAREIFAEIEAALHSAIEVNNATEHSENATTNKLVCTSKENAYLTTLCFLNQLKKKYGVE